jgi:hypothetical protein
MTNVLETYIGMTFLVWQALLPLGILAGGLAGGITGLKRRKVVGWVGRGVIIGAGVALILAAGVAYRMGAKV